MWPVFELFRDFIHVHLIRKFQEHPIKTEQVTLMTKSSRDFFSSQGDVTKMNNPIWPVFELVQDFIYFHLTCKFLDGMVKTEWLLLMTKSNRGFFNN